MVVSIRHSLSLVSTQPPMTYEPQRPAQISSVSGPVWWRAESTHRYGWACFIARRRDPDQTGRPGWFCLRDHEGWVWDTKANRTITHQNWREKPRWCGRRNGFTLTCPAQRHGHFKDWEWNLAHPSGSIWRVITIQLDCRNDRPALGDRALDSKRVSASPTGEDGGTGHHDRGSGTWIEQPCRRSAAECGWTQQNPDEMAPPDASNHIHCFPGKPKWLAEPFHGWSIKSLWGADQTHCVGKDRFGGPATGLAGSESYSVCLGACTRDGQVRLERRCAWTLEKYNILRLIHPMAGKRMHGNRFFIWSSGNSATDFTNRSCHEVVHLSRSGAAARSGYSRRVGKHTCYHAA